MMGAVRMTATSLTRSGRAGTRAARFAPALAAVAVGALALSGCAGEVPSGVAAVVDGRQISVAEVQEATEQFNSLPVSPMTSSDTLTLLIYGEAAEAAYTEAGLPPIPDSQLVAQLQGGGVDEPSDGLVDLFRAVSHLQGVGGLPPVDDMEVAVNPRFGGWDDSVGQIIAQTPAWITEVTTGAQN